jgi:hypothetical protein
VSSFFRPRREAVVRTPFDGALIRDRILVLAAGGPPTGFFDFGNGGRRPGARAFEPPPVPRLLVRPARTVTIRTRLDPEAIRRCLDGLRAAGGFGEVRVVGDSFLADYVLPDRNERVYTVEGRLRATEEWRFFDVRIEADEPWLSWRVLLALLAYAGLRVALGRIGWRTAVEVLVFFCVVQLVVNLVWSPFTVRDRVARDIAVELHGSVREGSRWVVPN